MSKQSKKSYLDQYQSLSESPAELWAISYGDLMTNLLVFFVMLMSASNMSAVKFESLKNAFQGGSEESGLVVIAKELNQKIAEHNLKEVVDVTTDETSVKLTFHESLLFDLGKSHLKPEAEQVLGKFAETLKSMPNYAKLAIEGYTDDNPVNKRVYESNWHLSALRSLSVLNVLEKNKICGANCEVRGFGEHHAALPNRDEKGQPIAKNQSENRRVVLRIY